MAKLLDVNAGAGAGKGAVVPKPGSISFEDTVAKQKPFPWGYGSTPRVGELRDKIFWKAAVTKVCPESL